MTYDREKKSVLIFFRGSWCPLCTLALAHVQQAQGELGKLGFALIAISSESPELLNSFAPVNDPKWQRPDESANDTKRQRFEHERLPGNALTFPVVTDPTSTTAEAFGLAFYKDLSGTEYERLKKETVIQQSNGKHWLPLPGIFICDEQGVIRFIDLNRGKDGQITKDYNRRLKTDELIAAARKVSGLGEGK